MFVFALNKRIPMMHRCVAGAIKVPLLEVSPVIPLKGQFDGMIQCISECGH